MNLNNTEFEREALPCVDSQAGLEARLLRLMELTLSQEQQRRCEEDSSLRPLNRQQLRRNAMLELMQHAEDGYFDHMNSLVKRGAVYTASIVAFCLGLMLLGAGQGTSSSSKHQMLGYNTVPAKIMIGSPHIWNAD